MGEGPMEAVATVTGVAVPRLVLETGRADLP